MARLYALPDKRALLFIHKAQEFLKAYTSNNFTSPRNAFLDRAGNIVATFHQKVISPDSVLIVIEKATVPSLLEHLEKYLSFSDTKLIQEEWNIYYDLEKKVEVSAGEHAIDDAKGRLILTKNNLKATVDEETYRLFRLKNNIPVQGVDYDKQMLLNIGDAEYVDYEKGCYLGQEIIARVHYKSKPPKKLVVRPEAECSPQERALSTSKCQDPATGKVLAFVFVENKG